MTEDITNTAELEALPLNSVVLDAEGDAWQKRNGTPRGETYWALAGGDESDSIRHYGPWTLIHRGTP